MLARSHPTRHLRALAASLSVVGLLGCSSDDQATTMLDAVVEVADTTFRAIDENEAWLAPGAEAGFDISGSLSNEIGGSLTIGGWRTTSQNDDGAGIHLAFGERVVVEVSQWEAAGVLLSGRMSVTRHSLDYGPSGGNIEDASRTTRYLAQVSGEGAAEGSFTVDVHAFASGSVLWTCGVVNETEIEFGRCF